jgi:triosephosphate isomerase (TIM)
VTRKPLIAGNWKMHGALAESRQLVDALRAGVTAGAPATMLLCPPYVYLPAIHGWLQGSPILLGAQDLADQPATGAYTGEISGQMLRDVGCSHVIVGHSERRALYGETDAVVATKFKAAQVAGLTPIVCVGETLEQREAGQTRAVISGQVAAVVDSAGVQAFAKAVIAYEPVWAIGTGRTASPEQAQEVHAFIRGMISARDATIAAGLSILYGGSVKGANARSLFAMADIDGGLVGGASLVAAEFLQIFRAAA